jgi:hypothetical protein
MRTEITLPTTHPQFRSLRTIPVIGRHIKDESNLRQPNFSFHGIRCPLEILTFSSIYGLRRWRNTAKSHPSHRLPTCTIQLTPRRLAMLHGKVSVSNTMANCQRTKPPSGLTQSSSSGIEILALLSTGCLQIPISIKSLTTNHTRSTTP